MYEINYIQLRLLCGDIRILPKRIVSRVAGGIPVSLIITDHTIHTTTLMLTYLFEEGRHAKDNRPDILIRIYHDSRQAEVLSHRCRLTEETVHYWNKDLDTMLLCRWKMNRFLYKWTNYLRRQGHSFA
ncbi:DUF1249 domain-containing protein [Thiothrix caldifontis]|nr:DUF1249 domain-containing protein [Thiothrix caldifontis]